MNSFIENGYVNTRRSRKKKKIHSEKELILLNIFESMDMPIGSGSLTGLLEDIGVNMSPASIGRMLSDLERYGLLKKDRNKGRVITDKGIQAILEAKHHEHIDEIRQELDEMLSTRTLQTFIKILESRKIIETATVRMAAEHITIDQLSELKNIVDERENHIQKSESITGSDVAFHSLIAQASGNEILYLLYKIISRLGQQSELFEYMRKQASGAYLLNHYEIYEALSNHDADRAEAYLNKHIDTLLEDVKNYWKDHPKRKQTRNKKKAHT